MEVKRISFNEIDGFKESYLNYEKEAQENIKERQDHIEKAKELSNKFDNLKFKFFGDTQVKLIRLGLIDSIDFDYEISEETEEIIVKKKDENKSEISKIFSEIFGRASEKTNK